MPILVVIISIALLLTNFNPNERAVSVSQQSQGDLSKSSPFDYYTARTTSHLSGQLGNTICVRQSGYKR